MSKVIKCAACGGRIRDHQPDSVLEDLSAEPKKRTYHYHEECGQAALKKIQQADPDVWRLTVRHVEHSAN